MDQREIYGAALFTGAVLCMVLLCGCVEEEAQRPDLSGFPGTFTGNVLLVTGNDIPQGEETAARELATYLNDTGLIRTDIVDTSILNRTELGRRHLIIVGTPETNPLVEEAAGMSGRGEITRGSEGEGRLLLFKNPWNTENLTLVVTGSDAWGVWAAAEALRSPENLTGEEMIVPSKIMTITGTVTHLSFGSAAAWAVWSEDGETYILQGEEAEKVVAMGESAMVTVTGYPTTTMMTIPEGGEMNRHQMKAIEVIRVMEAEDRA